MSYEAFILAIIEARGQWSPRIAEGTFNMHHIVPKSVGGLPKHPSKYSKHPNIIWLTVEEHLIAHKLLALENLNNLPLLTAFWLLYQFTKKSALDSHWLNTLCTEEELELISSQYKQLLAIASSGSKNNFFGKTHTPEVLQRISEKLSGRSCSEARKAALSTKMQGKYLGMIFIHKDTHVKRIQKEELEQYLQEGWALGNGRKGTVILNLEERELIGKRTKEGMQQWKESDPEAYESWRRKIGAASVGKSLSEEAKQKISLANSGTNNGMYNKPSPSRKKVYCKELDLIFDSVTEAAQQTKVGRSHISKCCKGVYGFKTAGGYHWAYVDDQKEELK